MTWLDGILLYVVLVEIGVAFFMGRDDRHG